MTASAARFDPAVEAAFQAVYGLDVTTAVLTPRRTMVLLRRLPPGAWTDPDSAASWTIEAHILASLVDAVNHLIWLTQRVNSKKAPKQPKPFPRPGQKTKPEQRAKGPAGIVAALAGMEGTVQG